MEKVIPIPLVQAKCTNCGANLTVDTSLKAAVCDYCRCAYVVDDAITNFTNSSIETISIAGSTVHIHSGQPIAEQAANLALRAEQFLNECQYDRADEYIERALDLDIRNETVQRVKSDPRFQIIRHPNCRIISNCWGAAVVVRVAIDGVDVAKLHDGQSVDVILSTIGKHTITVRAPMYGAYTKEIMIVGKRTFVTAIAKYKLFRITADIQIVET